MGVGAFTFHYAQGTSYLSNDPKACTNCHVMQPYHDGWLHGPHKSVATCNDCHVPHDPVGKLLAKGIHGWNHSKAFTLQNFHEPIQITARSLADVEANCVRCHETKVSAIIGGAAHASRGAQGDTGISCVRCHVSAGHGFQK
ncbi:MAG: cytochrome c nitrite reductase small subunit [Phycisphaerae bacterium]|nr:cytochrome c nitrite reductase small subunit [Phycisphaerae bacterium]